ncbi:universal stress protein [Candidatus Magnetaquicoccus inordinatus]|uniref:universal stress protein n=1 Tax=Candidatus Magnetaquicoccus inordinatus TaxID=2496818 RepID=UPI00102C2830|nr:universal stress protein [Candidatus Magnetaquicoccus inordinatus]
MVDGERPEAPLLLLAHHGTPGACAAEQLAYSVARAWQASILHLLVIPAFWRDMMGDDWLNNAATRAQFGGYLEQILGAEAQQQLQAVAERCCGQGLAYRSLLKIGEPTDLLLECVRDEAPAALVLGSPRPKGVPGVRSRIDMPRLMQRSSIPLLLAPWGWKGNQPFF